MDEDPTAPSEDVLGRLDALLNRDKAASASTTPNVIPLLTEIYQPAASHSVQPISTGASVSLSPEHIEQIVELLLPEMTRIMTKTMQDALTQQIQPALETALRERLTLLAQQKT
ncbi:MAG TPA: hypothetical protein VIE69_10625 [Methylophilaceae bacterium]